MAHAHMALYTHGAQSRRVTPPALSRTLLGWSRRVGALCSSNRPGSQLAKQHCHAHRHTRTEGEREGASLSSSQPGHTVPLHLWRHRSDIPPLDQPGLLHSLYRSNHKAELEGEALGHPPCLCVGGGEAGSRQHHSVRALHCAHCTRAPHRQGAGGSGKRVLTAQVRPT